VRASTPFRAAKGKDGNVFQILTTEAYLKRRSVHQGRAEAVLVLTMIRVAGRALDGRRIPSSRSFAARRLLLLQIFQVLYKHGNTLCYQAVKSSLHLALRSGWGGWRGLGLADFVPLSDGLW
jgi:hypothetical protein